MKDTARFLELQTSIRPRVGVVLGSGLGAFADSLIHTVRIPYSDLPGFPDSTVVGHTGELVAGVVGANGHAAADVIVMSGRIHLYEGYSAHEVAAGIRLFGELGVTRVILTNSAGAINARLRLGSLVLISDHINLQCASPLVGSQAELRSSRFVDMTDGYSQQLRDTARGLARELGINLEEGVYAAVLGPNFETPAEIRYLQAIGADLVGMSTAMETIAANHLGMEVLGISVVANAAAGLGPGKIAHQDTLDAGKRASHTMIRLLTSLVPKL